MLEAASAAAALAFAALAFYGLMAGAGFLPPPKSLDNELVCFRGRQYIFFQKPSPGLALVLSREGGKSSIAACGERIPEDVAERAREVIRRIDEISRMEEE